MSDPTRTAEIIPYLFYRDVPAALDWLTRVFGFTEQMRHATPGGMHAEMAFGGERVMLGGSNAAFNLRAPVETGTPTQGVFVYLDDVAAHHARTVAECGAVDAPPSDHGYGLTYTARDLDGHPWYFTQRPPSPS